RLSTALPFPYTTLFRSDLLELFAFVHPARFVVPTPKGLAHALRLPAPASDDAVPGLLQEAAGALLETCRSEDWAEREGAWSALRSEEHTSELQSRENLV